MNSGDYNQARASDRVAPVQFRAAPFARRAAAGLRGELRPTFVRSKGAAGNGFASRVWKGSGCAVQRVSTQDSCASRVVRGPRPLIPLRVKPISA